ncbi:MAG: aromatic acid exporter family protein [bacterium]|nr:aromatic acid exporter family protein [bacterium]
MRVRTVTPAARYMILKAGLVTAIALALAAGGRLPDPITAAFAAILCIPSAFSRGLRSGARNISATLIGAAAGAVAITLLPSPHAALPPAMMAVCAVCHALGMIDYFPLAAFTLLVLGFSDPSTVLRDALLRSLGITTGVGIAVVVNYLVSLVSYAGLYDSQFRRLLAGVGYRFRQMADRFAAADADGMERLQFGFHRLFREISAFIDEIRDLKREMNVRKESGGLNYRAAAWLGRISEKMAAVAHYSWDIVSLSPGLFRAGALPAAAKRGMDDYLALLERRLGEISLAVEEPGARGTGPPVPAVPLPAPAAGADDAGRLLLDSLMMSLRHLGAEIEALAETVRHFQEEVRGRPGG